LGNTTFAPPKFTLAASGRELATNVWLYPCAARGQQRAINVRQETDAVELKAG
jgi:hypothetical protein